MASPDAYGGIDSDGENIGTTTLHEFRTEEKHNRIDVEFQDMMHSNLLNGNRSVRLLGVQALVNTRILRCTIKWNQLFPQNTFQLL